MVLLLKYRIYLSASRIRGSFKLRYLPQLTARRPAKPTQDRPEDTLIFEPGLGVEATSLAEKSEKYRLAIIKARHLFLLLGG
jgi:hypothetical protein